MLESTREKYWQNKISNVAQVGGIETSILDNGLAKGTRVAWVNTGSGLRYKIVLDRAMDIAEAFFNAYSLAWISHPGSQPPNPAAINGIEWLKSFGGGLVTTCGLTHVGSPESDDHGQRGLHGRISNLPAEIISIEQPDIQSNTHDMKITGIIRESSVFGPNLEMKRTVSSTLFSSKIQITDEIRNLGSEKAPHMLLYHINLGWPLIDEETDIIWQGKWKSRGTKADNMIFNEKNKFKTCQSVMKAHSGPGEAVGFINPVSNENGWCTCGVHNAQHPLALFIHFKKEQLPCLTNWQHWGKREYVTALEPGNNWPIGQTGARHSNTLDFVHPGETKKYEIIIETCHEKETIQDRIKENILKDSQL